MDDDVEVVGGNFNFSGQSSLGSCPKCGGSVFENEQKFVCEKSIASSEDVKETCDFSLARTLLKQSVSREQFIKLLDTGKTDLLKGFVSLRTNKPFRARLIWDSVEGRVKLQPPEKKEMVSKSSAMVSSRHLEKERRRKLLRALPVCVQNFHSTYQSASCEFLEQVFKLNESLVDLSDTSPVPASLIDALRKVDQSIFCNFLSRGNCPDWLGIWIAKHGRKEQQYAYLFRPSVEAEMTLPDRISSRPPGVRQLFWSSKSAVIFNTLLDSDDELYLKWASDIGFDIDVNLENSKSEDESDFVSVPRRQVEHWIENVLDPVIKTLWKEHVPKKGACAVLQGELARCIVRLEHEYWKNGMGNMGNGYYDRMVDKIKKTVMTDGDLSPLVQKVLKMDALIVKGADYSEIVNTSSIVHPTNVEVSLNRIKMVVAAWCKARPEPIAFTPSALD
jgi:C-terminal repeat of topoisomerase